MAARRSMTSFHIPLNCAKFIARKPSKPPSLPLRPLHLRQSTTSSTSALAYKALHRRISPLPTSDSLPIWSAQAAVSSILYETPSPSTTLPKRRILNCLVQNEPGVLSRVSGILAARGFNIDSLVVCNTEVEDLSRMTIVLSGQDGVVEQARRQLEDLVPVWAVLDYTSAPLVQRELLLAKVSLLGPEHFEEVLAHHREMTVADVSKLEESQEESDTEGTAEAVNHPVDYHPSRLLASEALRHKHEHLAAITHLTHQFGGKVLDISTNNCVVEMYETYPLSFVLIFLDPLQYANQNLLASQIRKTDSDRRLPPTHLRLRDPGIGADRPNGSTTHTSSPRERGSREGGG